MGVSCSDCSAVWVGSNLASSVFASPSPTSLELYNL